MVTGNKVGLTRPRVAGPRSKWGRRGETPRGDGGPGASGSARAAEGSRGPNPARTQALAEPIQKDTHHHWSKRRHSQEGKQINQFSLFSTIFKLNECVSTQPTVFIDTVRLL